jgi:integrase
MLGERTIGIGDSKLHSLRHFYAATLISAGYDIDAVSKALGHSWVAITSLIYSSLFEAAEAKMAEAAETLVGRAGRPREATRNHYSSRSLAFPLAIWSPMIMSSPDARAMTRANTTPFW